MARVAFKMSYRELIVAFCLLGVVALLILPALSRAREASYRASCQNNLKQMGLVFKMFANENKSGVWPPVSPVPGNWIVDASAIYPEYLSDLSILVCPDSPFDARDAFYVRDRPAPQCVSSLFYTYTGYAIQRDEEAVALAETYYSAPYATFAAGSITVMAPVWAEDGDTAPAGTAWGQAAIPVMWDRIPLYDDEFSHEPAGANVLHMDAHVEFVRYSYYNPPAYFPVTRISAELFGSTLPRLPAECY